MNEHQKVPYRCARSALADLPVGTIAKGQHDVHPITRVSQTAWQIESRVFALTELQDVAYRVLYIPEPPLPKVGDELHREDLDRLPDRAIVLDNNNNAAQVELWGSDMRNFIGPCWNGEDDQSASALWRTAKMPLKLLWLPG